MAGGLTDDRVALKSSPDSGVVFGSAVIVLGCGVLAIAGVEYFLFAEIGTPMTGERNVLGLSFATTAYLGGYVSAGAILITLGIWKIIRARR